MLDLKVRQFIIASVILCILSYFHFYLLGFFFWTFGFVVFEDQLDTSEEDDDIFEVFLIDSANEFDNLEFRAQMRGYRFDDSKNKKSIILYYWQNFKITSRFWNFVELVYGDDNDKRFIELDENKFLDIKLESKFRIFLEKNVNKKNVNKKNVNKKMLINIFINIFF